MLEAVAAERLLCVAGLGGCPEVTLPYLRMSGAPHGISMITPPGTDRQLLTLTHRITAIYAVSLLSKSEEPGTQSNFPPFVQALSCR
jgi:Asp-tRNA(Asn)/Glu-tRNA(Gln) amidotransferase A subunit family amidase